MGSSTIGKLFTVTTFGESHGEALGCIVEGFPPNVLIDIDFIQSEMARRRPGSTELGTKRNEMDKIELLSGIYKGYSTGSPILMMSRNTDQRSKDYSKLENIYRPGHADFTFEKKYGIRDPRGGGRSSGRETLARVAAGALAKLYLKQFGITISAGIVQVGKVKATSYKWAESFSPPLYAPECNEKELMLNEIQSAREKKDSVGCVIECHIKNTPIGLGDPVFDKLDANLAKAIFSIGAVKGFEIGSGFSSSSMLGSENNDQMDRSGFITNNAGGILGGISNGNEIVFKAFFKPTPSISSKQRTVNSNNEEVEIEIEGRHDPCIGPRAVVVVEAMAAITILDALLIQRSYDER